MKTQTFLQSLVRPEHRLKSGFEQKSPLLGRLEPGRKSSPGSLRVRTNFLDALVPLFQTHGDKALSPAWLNQNGHSKLARALKIHGGPSFVCSMLALDGRVNMAAPKRKSRNPNKTGVKSLKIKANLIDAIVPLIQAHGEMALNRTWLCKNGHSDIGSVFKHHGNLPGIRVLLSTDDRVTLSEPKHKLRRSKENTLRIKSNFLAALIPIYETHRMKALSPQWLVQHGHQDIANAFRHHGWVPGVRALLLTEEVIALLPPARKPQKPSKSGSKSLKIQSNFLAAIFPLHKTHGEQAVNTGWLKKHGHADVSNAFRQHGGVHGVRSLLNEHGFHVAVPACHPKKSIKAGAESLRIESNFLAALLPIYDAHREKALSKKWLIANGHSDVCAAMYRYHGKRAGVQALLAKHAKKPDFGPNRSKAMRPSSRDSSA